MGRMVEVWHYWKSRWRRNIHLKRTHTAMSCTMLLSVTSMVLLFATSLNATLIQSTDTGGRVTNTAPRLNRFHARGIIPEAEDFLNDEDDFADFPKRTYNEYGHLRFGKRDEQFDDYGHLRFGRAGRD